jgi:hypothetical protein
MIVGFRAFLVKEKRLESWLSELLTDVPRGTMLFYGIGFDLGLRPVRASLEDGRKTQAK